MLNGSALSRTVGAVLDPIVSLRRRVRVRPGKTVHVVFSTLVASSRTAVLDLAEKYHDVTTFERVATLAWTQAQVQLHHLGIGPDEAHLFQTIGGSILYVDRTLRASAEVLARRVEGVSALWANGISGDLPIVLVAIDDVDDIGIVRQLLRAHQYWRMKRLPVDLVILNDRAPSYVQDLQMLIETLVRTGTSMPSGVRDARTGVHLRSDRAAAQLRSDQRRPGRSFEPARHLAGRSRGNIARRADHRHPGWAPAAAPRPRVKAATATPRQGAPHPALEFFNGAAASTPTRGYVITLGAGQWTPAPWINVIANPDFRMPRVRAGAGCTWSENSQENLLTAWSNDPVRSRQTFYS